MKLILPTRTIGLLMLIGFTDLVTTAWLHYMGLIKELNPVMAPTLEHGEWTFIVVKSLTLIAAWVALAAYARKDLKFVRLSCLAGSGVYLAMWSIWFFSAR